MSQDNNSKVTEPTRGTYKGHPVISLPTGSKHGFTFGLKKAATMQEWLDSIQEFVNTSGASAGEAEVGEFKGHPVVRLPNGSRYGLTFGLRKARAVIDCQAAVISFIHDNDPEAASIPQPPTRAGNLEV